MTQLVYGRADHPRRVAYAAAVIAKGIEKAVEQGDQKAQQKHYADKINQLHQYVKKYVSYHKSPDKWGVVTRPTLRFFVLSVSF